MLILLGPVDETPAGRRDEFWLEEIKPRQHLSVFAQIEMVENHGEDIIEQRVNCSGAATDAGMTTALGGQVINRPRKRKSAKP